MALCRFLSILTLFLIGANWVGCGERPTSRPDAIDQKKEVSPSLVERTLRQRPTSAKVYERMVGGVPVPKLAKTTFENDGTYNLSVSQTVEQLRQFYTARGFSPVDHPEGFAVFLPKGGAIVQILRGVGPRSEIVIIDTLTADEPAEVVPPDARHSAEELEVLKKRIDGGEPTENMPQPPLRDR